MGIIFSDRRYACLQKVSSPGWSDGPVGLTEHQLSRPSPAHRPKPAGVLRPRRCASGTSRSKEPVRGIGMFQEAFILCAAEESSDMKRHAWLSSWGIAAAARRL
jgi:hypothetical protein